ncbi:MAG: alpha-glucosidase C-terminal domain-containing protein [Saprospiraceae bacterium]|nr:alpha-glucosidase C-terminal domain-containing protein [Saprospiraceae bacterium]
MLKLYQKLIAIRAANQALKTGILNIFLLDIVAFSRKALNNEVLILVNVRNSNKSFALPNTLKNTTWKDAMSGETFKLISEIELKAFEYKC